MKIKSLVLRTLLAPMAMFLAVSCSDNDDDKLGTASLTVRLTDAPGDYDAVNVDIQDVQINYGESEEEGGWKSIGNIQTGVYDLLELTGGISAVLADAQVPAGKINQMRLVLGPENTIVIDGETFPLKTPSAMQSGLKLQVKETLEAGFTYDFLIDFDVDKSVIIEAGSSGNINLQPVLRVSTIFTSGKISGSVSPYDFAVLASIEADGFSVSAYADENGVFVLNGVPEGTYDVTITPAFDSGYAQAVISGVTVVNGQVTEMAPVALEKLSGIGNITGAITNEGVAVKAEVTVGENTYSASSDENGVFTLYNIPMGTQTLVLTPAEGSGLTSKTIQVEVTDGGLTDLGSITLE